MIIKFYTYFVSMLVLVLELFLLGSRTRIYFYNIATKNERHNVIILVFQIFDLRVKC